MSDKQIIQVAKIASAVLSPFYAPIWILIWLFYFSYMRLMPPSYKLLVILMVYIFTVLIPRIGINSFRIFKSWSHWQLSVRHHRHMPYLVTLISYSICLVLMTKLNMPMFIRGIVMSALVSNIICVILNAWWKVSTHMVGMGGLVGAILAFSQIFAFNPAFTFCILILISGILGTSRIILRQHSSTQVLVGFIIGLTCSMSFILLCWM